MDQDLNIVPTQIQFSPVNTPGKVDCIMNWWSSQPHEYFLHLFGKELLDVFIAETNLLNGQFRKVTLEIALGWKPVSHEVFSIFWLNNWHGTNN